ncbi:uncharacterized protein SCHCODRAFT_02330592 [Schizophyllum commune H4-8]|uniref:uncharacterized protein n=1 Tax=Schizophyllum commune (strain H4-8 / FGSC 9210) TaxID=578458 RepID=UPI00215E8C39|nr:uncharacterized protein SCHCODRAFT_02330592 [Schizophyllum commune H4-8]KAI5891855.1 hypothetical protein SCHCODRAFT_02330592 [Schizophyllum commune H4-8]
MEGVSPLPRRRAYPLALRPGVSARSKGVSFLARRVERAYALSCRVERARRSGAGAARSRRRASERVSEGRAYPPSLSSGVRILPRSLEGKAYPPARKKASKERARVSAFRPGEARGQGKEQASERVREGGRTRSEGVSSLEGRVRVSALARWVGRSRSLAGRRAYPLSCRARERASGGRLVERVRASERVREGGASGGASERGRKGRSE